MLIINHSTSYVYFAVKRNVRVHLLITLIVCLSVQILIAPSQSLISIVDRPNWHRYIKAHTYSVCGVCILTVLQGLINIIELTKLKCCAINKSVWGVRLTNIYVRMLKKQFYCWIVVNGLH